MIIFHLKARHDVGYDSYDSHVVIATTEEQARGRVPTADEAGFDRETRGAWWRDKENADCTPIGVTTGEGEEARVVISSFNAG